MAVGRQRRKGRTKAVRTAVRRLGRHAAARDVVALLAPQGIEVNESLVKKIQVEAFKAGENVKRHQERVKLTDKRRRRPMSQKKPAPRIYRR